MEQAHKEQENLYQQINSIDPAASVRQPEADLPNPDEVFRV